ncbi:MAG: hypothetical protein JST00_22835 [Deltaproteobacteria bacterium]|nr:hypothetical protein [Deltaproteobacteria bacterium]
MTAMRARIPAAATILVASMLFAPRASAQNTAAADVLFQKGKEAFDAKRYADACPAFAESYRLDPVSGSLVALAACYEADGKLASAWSRYGELAALADREGKKERADAARKRAAELEPKLARLTISVAPEAAGLEGLVVKRDGVALGAASFGTAFPVDRGEHSIEATAPGHTPFVRRVSAEDGARLVVAVPGLTADTSPAARNAGEDPAAATSGTLKTVGWVAVAAGGGGIVAGGIVGLLAISKNADSKNGCNADNICTPAGRQTRLDARALGDTSTVLFVAGGVVAAAGIVLVVVGGSSPSAPKASAAVAPTFTHEGAGVSLTGRF